MVEKKYIFEKKNVGQPPTPSNNFCIEQIQNSKRKVSTISISTTTKIEFNIQYRMHNNQIIVVAIVYFPHDSSIRSQYTDILNSANNSRNGVVVDIYIVETIRFVLNIRPPHQSGICIVVRWRWWLVKRANVYNLFEYMFLHDHDFARFILG